MQPMKENEYKVHVSTKKVNSDMHEFPQYFLGDSAKEAEEVFSKFKKYLNSLASSYHHITGIEKSELFGDGVLALGKAKRDFDEHRCGSFKDYAIFLIVDAMNECVRLNRSSIKVPSYINKSHKILNRIKKIVTGSKYSLLDVFESDVRSWNLTKHKISELIKDKELIENAAQRAKISVNILIERSEFLPYILPEDDILTEKFSSGDEQLLNRLIVSKMFSIMNEDEIEIASLLMEDMNKSDICAKLNKSITWVNSKIDSIRLKSLKILEK